MKILHVAAVAVLSLAALGAIACSPPVMNTPIDDIPKLKTLDEVMDNQATVADPAMGKRDQETFTDEEYASFGPVSTRIQALAPKIKDFTRGPEFDKLADKLGETAKALGEAATAKDAAKTSASLKEMKATCAKCHSDFR